jgi:hypothetical protein
MTTLVAQIAPQRSTQYAELASALAAPELLLSPLGDDVTDLKPITMGGQEYIRFDMGAEPNQEKARELGLMSMTSAFYLYYSELAGITGPLLKPIETGFVPALPPELIVARRYRGKTNEMFTHFMCNLARASSALADRPWSTLRLLDPLAGGATSLFVALVLGASVAGVEHNGRDVESTVSFLRGFAREQGIACDIKRERFKGIGKRWVFSIGKEQPQTCILAHGETTDTTALITGFRPHLIVTDLPYGIQHHGELTSLLTQALPIWTELLPPSGSLVMAWESTRFPRDEMIETIESSAPLTVLNEPPYDALAHRVDRVIKRRDVVVARPERG